LSNRYANISVAKANSINIMASPADTLPLDSNGTPGTDLEGLEVLVQELKPVNLNREVFMQLNET